MIIERFNNLNIEINKQYELLLAIHVVYILKHPEFKEKFDFIELPKIDYLTKLSNLINIDKYPEIIKYIINFEDCSLPIEIAIGLDDFYNVDYDKIKVEDINKYMSYGSIEGFTKELKAIATDVNWDKFFNEYVINFYKILIISVCNFPKNLDLNDINRFYYTNNKSYTFIPSVLMNGGFGISDKKENMFYNYGFIYDDKKGKFVVDNEYLVECLFHEFSHPIVNPLVDKYFKGTEILESLYEDAIQNNLPRVYSKNQCIILYEYLVRANAYILAKKYYGNIISRIEERWIVKNGFQFLPDLIKLTEDKLSKYINYEDFVRSEISKFIEDRVKKTFKGLLRN